MSYTVNWTQTGTPPNGKPAIVLPQLRVDTTSTSLTLTGKGTPNYGEIQQENFIRLLENFAASTSPAYPTDGQLWYDTTSGMINVYQAVDSKWHPVGVTRNAASPTPETSFDGDLWWDTDDNILYVYDGATWQQIWPTLTVVAVAFVEEYNKLVDRYNRIAGTPSQELAPDPNVIEYVGTINPDGTITQVARPFNSIIPNTSYGTYYGYGQESIPYETTQTMNNQRWLDLLNRFSKLGRHQGTSVDGISTRGFIPDKSSNYGISTCLDEYNNTIQNINVIEKNRFDVNPLSLENRVLANSSYSRIQSYFNQKSHVITVTFDDSDHMRGFFNAGGKMQFATTFSPSQSTAFNTSWQAFLATIGPINFSVRGTNYDTSIDDPIGLYDLTTTYKTIYRKIASNGSAAGAFYQIDARVENDRAIRFNIIFAPDGVNSLYDVYGSVAAIGTTVSTMNTFKPNSLYLNTQTETYPVVTQSGTFITDNTV